ncbi:MAG: SdrD B-like domain-containing protein [Pirellulaceae bacterium]
MAVLQPGDTNQDLYFDEADFIMAHKAGLFETGEPATWSEGDWNGAPGGEPGNPPIGDDEFNSSDYVAAFITGNYRIGPYDPEAGEPQHERTPLVTENGDGVAVVYHAGTGMVEIVSERPIDTFQLYSNSGLFLDSRPSFLTGLFDGYDSNSLFKLDPAGFAERGGRELQSDLLPPSLSRDLLLQDLEADGSFQGGGDIGDVLFFCHCTIGGPDTTVKGVVFHDVNENGVQEEGEVGVDDQTIIIRGLGDLSWYERVLVTTSLDLNGDGQIDPQAEQGVAFDYAPSIGQYELVLVTDENSLVRITHPIGGVQKFQITDELPPADIQFGVQRIEPATVQGQVFLDANENGEFDPGEEALGFTEIQLRASDTNRLVHQVVTMTDGTFEFLGIAPGEYRITADLPLGQVPLADVGLITLGEGQQHQANLPVVTRPYLLPGDSNQDYYVDPADFILAFKSGKFETGEPASWEEGDWDALQVVGLACHRLEMASLTHETT